MSTFGIMVGMTSEDAGRNERSDWMRYAEDEQLLAQLGHELIGQDPSGDLVVSDAVGTAAIAAWERDETRTIGTETAEASRTRQAAGTLALIGLNLKEHGVPSADGTFKVRLQPDYVDEALSAARGRSN